jgi:RHS repeat-associated protein
LAAISTSDGSKKQSHTFGVSGFRRKKKDKNDVETTEYATGLATAVSKTSTSTVTYLMGHRLMGLERSSDGAMFWFITDALSTVRDVVNSSGSVVASYEFSEYGQRISSSESGVSSQKTWVGGSSVQDEVADTGLMMMGHRFYDPSGPAGGTGRFLNRDPIGFRGSMNLFEYSRSSPTSLMDPSGLEPPASVMDRRLNIYTPNPREVHITIMEGVVPDDMLVLDAVFLMFPLGRGGRAFSAVEIAEAEALGLSRMYGPGAVVQLGAKGTPFEKAMAERLAERGFYVETRFGSNCTAKGAGDLFLEGAYGLELKTIGPTGQAGIKRGLAEIERSIGKGLQGKNFLLDYSSEAWSKEMAESFMARLAGKGSLNEGVDFVWLYTKDADYIWKAYP